MTASIFNKNSKIGLITAAALVSILTIISISFVLSAIHTRTAITNAIITPNKKVVSVGKTVEENHTVPLDQIVSGGPPPDGIPSIDNPKFVSIQEADDKFLHDDDLILGLNINGDIRAYPLQILVWHEIVNDNVGGMPVAVTYCPLCFTNQVFKRIIDNNVVAQFGTSGKLYNSNLVMYDRKSKSLWSQVLAEGIVGKYAGSRLQRIPFDIAKWSDWKQLYPNSKVLSTDTGFSRPYGADPYNGYYTSNELLFPVSHRDDRLNLKEIIVGVENGGQFKAYKLQQIENNKVINDAVNGKAITLLSIYPHMVRMFDAIVDGKILNFEYANSNSNRFKDKQTGSEWNFDGKAINGQMQGKQLMRLPFDQGFWFEWVAFHPQTSIYRS